MIQGAAGATILACGLSLLTVATSGDQRLKYVSLWGAAAAVGAAAGPLLGGVLVDLTGWQGLFWIDAGRRGLHAADLRDGRGVARRGAATLDRLPRHRADRADPRAADLRVTKSGDWGWISAATLGCFARPDRRRLRSSSRPSSGSRCRCSTWPCCATGSWSASRWRSSSAPARSTALMYLLSLYFQNPAALGFSPLEAGIATLPATVGLVVVAPFVPRLAEQARRPPGDRRRLHPDGRRVRRASASSTSSWAYTAFLLPILAIAVGMGSRNGPVVVGRTTCVRQEQVGEASGVSNMARYVGAAVATALAADDLRQRPGQPARRRRERPPTRSPPAWPRRRG